MWIPTDPLSNVFFPSQTAVLSQLLSTTAILNTHIMNENERYKKEIGNINSQLSSRDAKIGNLTRFVSDNKRHMRTKSQRIVLLEAQLEDCRIQLALSQDISKFRCNICTRRMIEVVLGCKHTLCNKCTDQLMAANDIPICPFCREEITRESIIQLSFT